MFWKIDQTDKTNSRLYDASRRCLLDYSDLSQQVALWEAILRSERKLLVALFCDNSLACIAAYLAALRTKHTVMLVNAATDSSLKKRLLDIYEPEIVISVGATPELPDGYDISAGPSADMMVAMSQKPADRDIFPDTAVLLSTSGTTGSPKLIRLSYDNLQANAESIVQYLEISPTETAITTLPLSYSYGLSVINSHLLAGASVICTNSSILTKEFWEQCTEHHCTSFAGVPFSYAMLERLSFERMSLPSLKTMTQAGGRLAPEKVQLFADIAKRKDLRFFVMYGQTEATARISYVPWDRVGEKPGSIGVPIPGGNLRLMQNGREIVEPHCEGELVYTGPNVMLGYAESRHCLAKGDELHGTLYTGDLGRRDAEGYFYITGRLKRFVKVFGLRLNLDEIEKMLEATLGRPVACAGKDEDLQVLVESDAGADALAAQKHVISLYKLHHSAVRARHIRALPVTASGKKDYSATEREFV